MVTTPDHQPEPGELKKPLEGERGRELNTPDTPPTRPEDLPEKVDAGIKAVEDNLQIVPTAFGEASKHFGVAPENLVVEPDASELAASRQQLDSAGHHMHDIATALSGEVPPTEPTLLQTEPQMSPMAGTDYEPAQLPVDNGPSVDGVRTPVATPELSRPTASPDLVVTIPAKEPARNVDGVNIVEPTIVEPNGTWSKDLANPAVWKEADARVTLPEKRDAGSDIVIETEEAPDTPHSDTFQVTATEAAAKKPESTPMTNADRPRIIMPEPPTAEQERDRIVEEAFFKAGEKANETGVVDYSGYSEEMLHSQREAINKELDETDMLVGKKDATGKVVTQERIDDLHRQQEQITNVLENARIQNEPRPTITLPELSETEVRNYKMREGVEQSFTKRVSESKVDANKETNFKVGDTINLPKHFSVDDQAAWQVVKVEKGQYLLEQTNKDGEKQHLVTSEEELAIQGVKPKETTKGEGQFKERVAKVRGESKMSIAINVGETVSLPIKYDKFKTDTSLMSKFAESPWKVAKADKGVFLLEKTDKFGNTQQLVLDNSELSKEGVKKSTPEKAQDESIRPEKNKPQENKVATERPKPQQNEYYRTIHETALQKALQEARNDPEEYAKLAGSVVGATMRYNADGGATFVDRQGQVVKELGKDKVDEARLVILKDRLVPDMIRNGMRVSAELQTELTQQEKILTQYTESGETDSDEYTAAQAEASQLKEEIIKMNTWMQDLKDGKGNFSVSAEGAIQVTGPDGETPFTVDSKKAVDQQNIVSLQTEKKFTTRQAIKELGNSKLVPEAFHKDIADGNFNFTVNEDMTVNVKIIGGPNDGNQFQLAPKITEGILDGSLPKGDATPDVADLQKQTDPDTAKDEEKDNATEDEEIAKNEAEIKTAIQEKIDRKETPVDTALSRASDAMRESILSLASSEWQAAVKPFIESMQRVGVEHLAIRADNKGNLYAGIMSEDGKHMVKRLTQRIEADSQVGRSLNNDPSMIVLRSLENTVKEEATEKAPDAQARPGTKKLDVVRLDTTSVHGEISNLVQSKAGADFNSGERAQLIDLIGKLNPDERLNQSIRLVEDTSLSAKVDDIIDIFSKTLNASEQDRAIHAVVREVYKAAGYEQSVKLVNFIKDENFKANSMRILTGLNADNNQARQEKAA